MSNVQKYFLKDEVWLLSFAGSFQRNKIYKPDVSEKQREGFRKELRDYLETDILPIYEKTLKAGEHCDMITKIIENSKKHKAILNNNCLSVGTVQKLLNLLLKYYWCLGWFPEPPHFPIDSRIQKLLPIKSRISWTRIESLKEYQSLIDCAKEQLKEGESLAEWELANFKIKSPVL